MSDGVFSRADYVSRVEYNWMVQNRDEWQQRAEDFERASKVDANTVQRMTDEVYRLNEAGEKLLAECNRIAAERDAALAQVVTVTAERDVALADVSLQLAAKNVIIAERDAAERERTESRAEVVQLRFERDAALYECKVHLDLIEDFNRQIATIASLQSEIASLQSDLEKANKKASEATEIEDRLHATLDQLEQCREERLDLRKKYAEIKNRHLVPDEIFGILTAIEANANLAKSKIYSR